MSGLGYEKQGRRKAMNEFENEEERMHHTI
jgi:hypothetical protein